MRRHISSLDTALLKEHGGNANSAFTAALANPKVHQKQVLSRIIGRNKATVFGRAHGFADVTSYADYVSRVPIGGYDDHAPYIERSLDGEEGVLTADPIRLFERTSGSTRERKYIPYTDSLLEEFACAITPWIIDLYDRRPELQDTRSYWSLSPLSDMKEKSRGGIPFGVEDDSDYFAPSIRAILRNSRIVQGNIQSLPMDEWREATVDAFLGAEDLGFVSVFSPSLLILILEWCKELYAVKADKLASSRRTRIEERANAEGQINAYALWPNLRLISAWGDGPSTIEATQLKQAFPRAEFQAKGLLSTEGVVSTPFGDAADPVLATTSHFLEFVPVAGAQTPIQAHELEVGASYEVLLTTSGGLYRYSTGDIITATGMLLQTPTVRFVGRTGRVSDLRGEKLDDGIVQRAFARAVQGFDGPEPSFMLLSPSPNRDRYTLFIDWENQNAHAKLATQLDAELCQSEHYKLCRKLGQLEQLNVAEVSDARRRFAYAQRNRNGARLGDIKPISLDVRGDAYTIFQAE